MIILMAVLALVVVQALAKSPWGVFTMATTIPVAIIMGIGLRSGRINVKWITAFGLLGLAFGVWGGQFLSHFPTLQSWCTHDEKWLAWSLMIYGFAASTLPVWLLLTPRDYLSTFLKLGTVAVTGGRGDARCGRVMLMPSISRFIDGSGPVFAGPVFPFVCITIACGAVSGFHSLIASGTTPKMIARESRIRDIGYGAMVVEMMVALMAMVAACVLEPGEYFAINSKGAPAEVVAKISAARISGDGIGDARSGDAISAKRRCSIAPAARRLSPSAWRTCSARVSSNPTALALWYHFAIMFEALFILTTIDAGTRVGRFLLQDLLGNIVATARQHEIVEREFFRELAAGRRRGAGFLYQGVIDPLGGINTLWPLFGLANQLLSVIALCFGTTLLIKMGKARYIWTTLAPLVFMCAVTFSRGLDQNFFARSETRIFERRQSRNPATRRQAAVWRFDAFVAGAFSRRSFS